MIGSNRVVKSFLPALYPVAVLLTVSPFMEVFGSITPVRPSLASWRFGVIGLGFNAMIAQTLGIALAMAVAAFLGHRRLLRFASVGALVAAVVVVAGIARFLLDFGQIQALIPATDRSSFDTATLRALVLASLVIPVLVVLGGRGWVASGVTVEEPADPLESPRVIPFPSRARASDPRWPRR